MDRARPLRAGRRGHAYLVILERVFGVLVRGVEKRSPKKIPVEKDQKGEKTELIKNTMKYKKKNIEEVLWLRKTPFESRDRIHLEKEYLPLH